MNSRGDAVSFPEFIGRLNLELARMEAEWRGDQLKEPEHFPDRQPMDAWMEHVQTLLWWS